MFNDDYVFGDDLGDVPRFRPVAHYHRMGTQKVFYKTGSDAPKQEESEREKAFAKVARERWRYQKDTFDGAKEAYMGQVDRQDDETSYQHVKGAAGNAVKKAYSGANEKLAESGMDMGSGRFRKSLFELSEDEAESGADTMGRAQTQQQDEYVTGVRNVSAMGRGEANKAQRGLGDVAYLANQEAERDAVESYNDSAFKRQTVGTVAGMAARGLQEVPFGQNQPGSQIKDYTGEQFKSWASNQ